MELTEVYTGFRRSKHRRMERSRVRSGSHLKNTLEIGEIISRKDSVSNSTKVETSTRVCGLKTRDMVKELTGELKAKSYAESTQEIGMRTRNMEEELSFTKTEIGTMDTG